MDYRFRSLIGSCQKSDNNPTLKSIAKKSIRESQKLARVLTIFEQKKANRYQRNNFVSVPPTQILIMMLELMFH